MLQKPSNNFCLLIPQFILMILFIIIKNKNRSVNNLTGFAFSSSVRSYGLGGLPHVSDHFLAQNQSFQIVKNIKLYCYYSILKVKVNTQFYSVYLFDLLYLIINTRRHLLDPQFRQKARFHSGFRRGHTVNHESGNLRENGTAG